MVVIKRWAEPLVEEETVTKVVTKVITHHVTVVRQPTVFISKPSESKGIPNIRWHLPREATGDVSESKEGSGIGSVESAMMKRWSAIEDKLKSEEVSGHEEAVNAEREVMREKKKLQHHESSQKLLNSGETGSEFNEDQGGFLGLGLNIKSGEEKSSEKHAEERSPKSSFGSGDIVGIIGTRGPGKFVESSDLSSAVDRVTEILKSRGEAMDKEIQKQIFKQYEKAGKYKDALRMANYALAMVNVLGASLSESTYNSLRDMLVELRSKLVSPKVSDSEKATVAAQIMALYNKIKERFLQHVQNIGKMPDDSLVESTDTFAGVGGALPTFDRNTVMSLPGGQGKDVHVELPESIAKRLEEEYKKAEEGMVPAPTLADQAVWTGEKVINTVAFWPQMVAENLASQIDKTREEYLKKANEALNKGDKAGWQRNMLAVQILDALSMLTRFGGSAATAGWDVALTAFSGGMALPVIVGAAADNMARAVTDDWQREAIEKSMKDPELFAKYVLPVLAGSVVGGVAGAKAVSVSTDWVLKNLNAGGKTGTLARALFKVGQRTGVFKTVKFTSEPTQSSVMFVKSQDGKIHVIINEKGNIRAVSKVPLSDDFSVRLRIIKGKSPQLADEIITYVKEAALTKNPKAIQALDKLVRTLSNVDDKTIKWVTEALKKMKEIDPDKIMQIEAYIRMTRGGGGQASQPTNIWFEGRFNNEYVRGGMSIENAKKYDMYYKKVIQWMEKTNPDKGTVDRVLKFYKATGLTPDELSPDEVALMTKRLGASRFEKLLKIFQRGGNDLDELANMRKLQQIARIYREGEGVGQPYVPYSPNQVLKNTNLGKLAKLFQNMDDAEWNAFLRIIKAKYGDEGVQIVKHLYNPAKEGVGVRVTVGMQGQSVTFEGGVGRGWRMQGATYSEVNIDDVLRALRRFSGLKKGGEAYVIQEKTLILPRGREAQFLQQLLSQKDVTPVNTLMIDAKGNAVYAVKLKDFLKIMKNFNMEPNELMEAAKGSLSKNALVLVKVYNKAGAPKSVRVALVAPKDSLPVVGTYRSIRVIQIEPKEFLRGIVWEEAKKVISKNDFEGALRQVLMQAKKISQEQNIPLDKALEVAKSNFITKLMKDVSKAGNVAPQEGTVFNTVAHSGGMKAVVLSKLIDKAVDELAKQMKNLPKNTEPVTVVADVNPASMGVAVAVVTAQKPAQKQESKSEVRQEQKQKEQEREQGESFQPWFVELPQWWDVWAYRDRSSQVEPKQSSEVKNPPSYIGHPPRAIQMQKYRLSGAEDESEWISYPGVNPLESYDLIEHVPGGILPKTIPFWMMGDIGGSMQTRQSGQYSVVSTPHAPTSIVIAYPTRYITKHIPWTVPWEITNMISQRHSIQQSGIITPWPTYQPTQVVTQSVTQTPVIQPTQYITRPMRTPTQSTSNVVSPTQHSSQVITQYVTKHTPRHIPWTVPWWPTHVTSNVMPPTHHSTQVVTQSVTQTSVIKPKGVITRWVTVYYTVGPTVLVTQYITPTVVVTQTATVTQIVTQWITKLARVTQQGGSPPPTPSTPVIAPTAPPVVPPFFGGSRPSFVGGFYGRSGRGRQREVIEL